jgi:Lipase (class 3)
MNLQLALQMGVLVGHAYEGFYNKLPNFDGQSYEGFDVVQTIYCDDLATDISPNIDPLQDVVAIGFVGRSRTAPDEYVLVVRGTEGVWEWIQDAKILPVPFPIIPGAGLTEDGFTDMYQSMRVGTDPKAPRLVPSLAAILQGPDPKLTICGHSLGSSLATLLALDVAVNSPYKQPTLITFASPRVGNQHFADFFNASVPNAYRIANRMDVVAHVPVPPLYIHVGDVTELTPGSNIQKSLLCMHDMATYMYLLNAGATPLAPTCIYPPPPPASPPLPALSTLA